MTLFKTLLQETRPQYLLLSVLLVMLGSSVAVFYGAFQWSYALLCLVGLVLLHISTNVLNDYFDYTSGIDLVTQRTPFNGGSGLLNQGLLTPHQVLSFGLVAFALAVPIGGYFVATVSGLLLPLFLLGSIFVVLGTSYITKLGYGLGELAAGLGLGALPVFGTAWILHGSPSINFIYASIPSALWVTNLLFLNEFPDAQADQQGGRKTLVIQLGIKRALQLYVLFSSAVWVWILMCVLNHLMPAQCLLAFLALPLAIKAIRLSRQPEITERFMQAQASNVGLVLSGHFLLALGYCWASI